MLLAVQQFADQLLVEILDDLELVFEFADPASFMYDVFGVSHQQYPAILFIGELLLQLHQSLAIGDFSEALLKDARGLQTLLYQLEQTSDRAEAAYRILHACQQLHSAFHVRIHCAFTDEIVECSDLLSEHQAELLPLQPQPYQLFILIASSDVSSMPIIGLSRSPC